MPTERGSDVRLRVGVVARPLASLEEPVSGSSPTVRLSDTNGFVNTIRPMGRNSRSCRTLTDDGTTHWADDSVLGLGGDRGGG